MLASFNAVLPSVPSDSAAPAANADCALDVSDLTPASQQAFGDLLAEAAGTAAPCLPAAEAPAVAPAPVEELPVAEAPAADIPAEASGEPAPEAPVDFSLGRRLPKPPLFRRDAVPQAGPRREAPAEVPVKAPVKDEVAVAEDFSDEEIQLDLPVVSEHASKQEIDVNNIMPVLPQPVARPLPQPVAADLSFAQARPAAEDVAEGETPAAQNAPFAATPAPLGFFTRSDARQLPPVAAAAGKAASSQSRQAPADFSGFSVPTNAAPAPAAAPAADEASIPVVDTIVPASDFAPAPAVMPVVPGKTSVPVATKYTPSAAPAQFASTPFGQAVASLDSAGVKIKNILQSTDKEVETKQAIADGIVPADADAAMTPSFNSFAQSAATLGSASAGVSAPAETPAAGASKATEAVRLLDRVAEAADRLAANPSGHVNVRIDLDDTNRVDVRVSMRGGRIQADFRTDSVEMRQALSAAWSGFAAARAEHSARWAEPVIAALNAPAHAVQPVSTSPESAGGFSFDADHGSRRQENARSEASPAFAAPRSSGSAERASSSSAPALPRVTETSRHLSLIA